MDSTEQFLSLYKEYETLLRARGREYREEEAAQDALAEGRMRMMRQMRNYLSHSADPGFLAVSGMQLAMLGQMVQKERLRGDIMANHMLPVKRHSCEDGCPARDALAKMAQQKRTYMPVTKGGCVLGLVSVFALAKLCAKQPDALLTEKSYGKYDKKKLAFIKPDDAAECLETLGHAYPAVCCTKDGTPGAKLTGIWFSDIPG